MTPLPIEPARLTAGLARPGFLTPSIRRDVADLNRQYLDLALEPALRADPRLALPEGIPTSLLAGDDAMRTRVASCPFTLFEILLGHGSLGGCERGGGVEDTTRSLLDTVAAARVHAFATVAVFLAWRLADGEPHAFRIVFGLSPVDELRLNDARPTDLPRLANAPRLLRPRWLRQPRLWRLLVRAADTGSDATLQRVHCAGICSVIADLEARTVRSPEPPGRGAR